METKGSGTQSREELEGFAAEQLGSGKAPMAVVSMLMKQGMTQAEARSVVDTVHTKTNPVAQEEEFSSEVLVPALLGGLVAAILGGAIWGGIIVWTGFEIGYVAWGVGALCGFGVVLMSKDQRGMPLQVIAVAASVLGILIGKYIAFWDVLKSMASEESGAEVAAEVSLFSPDVMQFFMENLSAIASGYDALWIVLAVITAWSIPKPSDGTAES